MEYLYKTFLLIPLINYLALFVKRNNEEIDINFSLNISKLSSLVFLAFLIGISTKTSDKIYSLFAFNQFLDLKFYFDSGSILISYAIALAWISLIFYIEYFLINEKLSRNSGSFVKYLPLSIALTNMLNFALTIHSAVFAYSILIFLFLAILLKSITQESVRKSSFSITFFLSQILLLFVILVIAGKYSSVPDLVNITYPIISSSKNVTLFLLLAVFALLLANFLMPIFYLFRNKVDNQNPNIINAFVLNFCLAQMLFFKFAVQKFFSIGIFSDFLLSGFISVAQTALILSMIVSLVLIFLLKDITKIFFLILYNQFSLYFLMIFIDYSYLGQGIAKIIATFTIFSCLLFMIFNNIVIYMQKLNKKDLTNAFSNFKINILILIFCFLNLGSLLPPSAPNIINFLLLNQELNHNTTNLVVIINSLILLMVGLKISFSAFKSEEMTKNTGESNDKEAKKIDFSSSLTLTPLAISVIIFILSFLI